MTNYPCVPGHELAGVVTAVGKNVTKYKVAIIMMMIFMMMMIKMRMMVISIEGTPVLTKMEEFLKKKTLK